MKLTLYSTNNPNSVDKELITKLEELTEKGHLSLFLLQEFIKSSNWRAIYDKKGA